MRALCRLVVCAAALASAGVARADGLLISADANRPGRIDVYVSDEPGSRVSLAELVGHRRVPVRDVLVGTDGLAHLPAALTWRCSHRVRRLVASSLRADGTTASTSYAVRTPGCRDRLALEVPASARPGTVATVSVVDRWALGDVHPRLCVRPPRRARARCSRVAFDEAGRFSRRLLLSRDGLWRVDALLHGSRTRAALRAGFGPAPAPGATRPVLLVTGDSTVQGIDVDLGDRLRRSVTLQPRFRPGSGLSHEDDPWTRIADRQAHQVRPRVTVISVGASDGYPMTPPGRTGAVPCCSAAWQAEYARRTASIMRSFARDGRGYVLWLSLPAPEDPRRAAISRVVNAVVRRTAPTVPGVVVVRVDRALTPGWRFRRTVGGRVVRMPDGIHLTPAGAAIATSLVLRALAKLPWNDESPA